MAALLPGIDPDARAERMSGGERRRIALAALLLGTHDLLLLDEPTNHLDIEAIAGWPGTCASTARAFVVVTHDRWFLDAVTEQTWEVADGRVHAYDGGYSAYVLARAERERIAEATDQRRRNLLRKELAWLRRGPPARTSKPKFRVEAATALIADEPAPRDGVELAGWPRPGSARPCSRPRTLSVRAGDRALLDDVTWRLGPGERVGVVGVNGSGKTTLLRLLAGADLGAAGRSGRLPRDQRPRACAARPCGSGTCPRSRPPWTPGCGRSRPPSRCAARSGSAAARLSASQLLDRLGLRGDRQWVPVAELSGGERRRLQLMTVLMDEPNVLLLDEPTNDLDIDTLTELEDMLDGWPGSLVVVSHDRYFLERVTDHVVALLGGQLAYLPGGVAEYLERLDRQHAAAAPRGRRPAVGWPAGLVRGPAAGGAEGARPAGTPARPGVRPGGRADRGAGRARRRLHPADRPRRAAAGRAAGEGRARGPLAHPGRRAVRLTRAGCSPAGSAVGSRKVRAITP